MREERSSEIVVEKLMEALGAAGIEAIVEIDGNAIVLSGTIGSEEERLAAGEIVGAIAPDYDLEDDLLVATILPEEAGGLELSTSEVGGFRGAATGASDSEALEPGDFTDQRLLDDPAGAAGPSDTLGTHDDDFTEGEEVYVPPIDPVRDREDQVLGGFAASSMDDVEPERSSDDSFGDEAIADAVRRELREDSATSSFDLAVSVQGGIVSICGKVNDFTDLENVEEVASRVTGVTAVREAISVTTI